MKRIFGGDELLVYDKNATNNIDEFIDKINNMFNVDTTIQQIRVIVGDTKITLNRNKLQANINYLKEELIQGKSAIIDDNLIFKKQ